MARKLGMFDDVFLFPLDYTETICVHTEAAVICSKNVIGQLPVFACPFPNLVE